MKHYSAPSAISSNRLSSRTKLRGLAIQHCVERYFGAMLVCCHEALFASQRCGCAENTQNITGLEHRLYGERRLAHNAQLNMARLLRTLYL
jgi:hypothetical protein